MRCPDSFLLHWGQAGHLAPEKNVPHLNLPDAGTQGLAPAPTEDEACP